MNPPYLSLVVPVYNSAACLPRALAALEPVVDAWGAELILVDDGSTDGTAALLAERAGFATVIHLPANRGKGHAVARGMKRARGRLRLFTDVDLAYPLDQIRSFVEALEQGADVAIACRVSPTSRFELSPDTIPYVHSRHLLSRLFNRLVRSMLLPELRDTQAGLKGFTAAAANALFADLLCERWAFDLEVLAKARGLGLQIVELPVTFRYYDDPSSFRLARHGAFLLRDLVWLSVTTRFGTHRRAGGFPPRPATQLNSSDSIYAPARANPPASRGCRTNRRASSQK